MYDLLLFPGELSSKQQHSVLYPLMYPSLNNLYLTESNFLSEFDTKEEKDKVVLNLGLDDYFVLESELEDIVDKKIKDEVDDLHSWVDIN